MKIHATHEYKIMISDYYNLELAPIDERIDKQTRELTHPNVLSPCAVSRRGNCLYLHYIVSDRGTSLRTFINNINSQKRGVRASFVRGNHIPPHDLVLQLIDALTFMAVKRMMVGGSYVNPDFIWVDYLPDGKMTVSVIDTLETVIDERYRIANENKQYWSPECLKAHNAERSAHEYISRKPSSLSRTDTVPSSFSLVYSLGLVLYFATQNHDPYEDGVRTYPDERPNLIEHLINHKIGRLVWAATEPDTQNRPTMAEFHKLVVASQTGNRWFDNFVGRCRLCQN